MKYFFFITNAYIRMDILMDDLKGNKKLTPIPDDGAGDIAIWNKVRLVILH